ncbi:MAG: hypothetical protein K6F36_00405 [Bacilli bacterium]|nr:hypothetical protein [Bacilli bacterium]
MKKKHAILPLLAMTVLSSCGYGQEIEDKAKIKELSESIANGMMQAHCCEANIKCHHSLQVSGADKENYDVEIVYRYEHRGEEKKNKYFSILYKDALDESANFKSFLYVADEKDKLGLWYLEHYSNDGEVAYAWDYSRNNQYTFAIPNVALPAISFLIDCYHPSTIDERYNPDYSNSDFKYYSKGEGNLTIDSTETKEEKYNQTSHIRRTYNDFVLESAESEITVNSNGRTEYEKCEVKFKVDNSVSVSIPEDWQDNIKKQNSLNQRTLREHLK